ncbi:hypothetical protein Tco_0946149 [Tanacetum coccineum]
MGELTFFLGLQVKQQPDGIFISQDKYVVDILKKFDFWSIRTATTPIESNKPLVKDEDGVDVDVHVYRTYEEHGYELNNNMTKDLEEPWLEYGVPYQLCDHICEPYRYKNGKVKWPTCNADIDRFCNGGELPGMVRVGCMTYLQNHQWYDELTDGVLKEEALMYKARFEGSWGYTTPGVMKFCA